MRTPPWIAAALGALLVFAAPAAAAPLDAGPTWTWEVDEMRQTGEIARVAGDTQQGGVLDKTVGLGPSAFDFEPVLLPGRAVGSVFSTASGRRYHARVEAPIRDALGPRTPEGGETFLRVVQAYEKEPGQASLSITISRVLLDVIDRTDPAISTLGCVPLRWCAPYEASVKFSARADDDRGDFFVTGGTALIQGARWEGWVGDAGTFAGAPTALWTPDDFTVTDLGSEGQMRLKRRLRVKVPLSAVDDHERFTVHVQLTVDAFDDPGKESAVEAFIQDPQHGDPPLLRARGLTPVGKPRLEQRPLRPLPAARCLGGRPRGNAGRIQFGAPAFATGEGRRSAQVLVTRAGGSRGAASVNVGTIDGSAQAASDFRRTSARVRFDDGDSARRLVEIPIRGDGAVESPEAFTVSLSGARCAKLGARRRATVTILDDDAPPPAPAPAFTIGGTVDGLEGSGLVLSNLGVEVPVSANGSFTFPGTASDGQTYEVNVKTQPHSPDQVCSVEHGAGHVSGANVKDVAVRCATLAAPPGLDTTFGSGGRVSTPVGGGQGEAVVIQPGGAIVTAGWRAVGAGTDFALTRHDAAGNLDRGFGTDGIATTDLGGARDQAHDTALTPDGGIVAVGETDAPGIQKQDFGVVRSLPGGAPDPGFDTDGVVTTDFTAHGDVANAVAVQGDGKIVVAGFTTRDSGHTDFALTRYDSDGALDPTFDGDGRVTTDFGALSDDDARAIAIQPDGRIVAAGSAGEDVGLVRYLPDGSTDPTFGTLGRSRALPGSGGAHGVTVTPAGTILVAGSAIGPNLTSDFLLAGFRSDGTLNPGFGHLGSTTTDLGSGADFAEDLTLDDQGRIVLVGRATSPTIFDMALARYSPGGTLDTSFASQGILTTDFHGRGDFGQDLALDSAGRIVAAGHTANGPDSEFALMRASP